MRAMEETWILQCRPGFEAECAAESGGAPATEGIVTAPGAAMPLIGRVFARQAFRQAAHLTDLPAGDRITPILEALAAHPGPVGAILLENPDSNAGKELAGFIKRFAPPLTSALAKRGLPVFKKAERRLHLLFTDSKQVYVGFSSGAEGSPQATAILPLKSPNGARSRSTLKLEEA